MCKSVPDNIFVATVKASARSSMKYHIGACIFKNNKIISTGFNKSLHCGNTKYLPKHRWSIHAEIDALMGLPKELTYGASIFIYRRDNRLAKPCSKCQKAIARAGISHIYYSPI